MSVQSLSHKMQQQAVTHSRLYAPLNPKTPEIRVVKLLPSQDFNAPIECELSHRPLYSESDGYESLSYVWGAPEFVGEILLSGESQPTTRNLEMALRYLRLPSCTRTLWVDAICINQSDPIERGQQVRLMRDIYANCKMDLAWMLSYKCTLEPPETGRDGESSVSHPSKEKQLETIHQEMETIGKAMELMKKINVKDATTLDRMILNTKQKRFVYEEPEIDSELDIPGRTKLVDKLDEFLLSSEQSWLLSTAFHDAPIWARVWTMQELSHAPHVVLVAGPYQLDWEIVTGFLGEKPYADAFHALYGHGDKAKALESHFGGSQKVDHQRRIMEAGHKSKLLDVLARFQSNRATDPRDRIYGLLGLATDQRSIVVDYKKSPAQVFQEATLSLIEDARNLDILCQTTWTTSNALTHSRLGRGVSGLPTWVLDFSREVVYNEHLQILFSQREIYKAGKPNIDVPCKVVDNRFLQLQALILGRVKCDVVLEGTRALWNHDNEFAPQNWLEESEIKTEITDKKEQYKGTGEAAFRAYWRTLLMDCAAYPITRLTNDEVLAGDAAFTAILQYTVEEDRFDKSQGRSGSLEDEGLTQHWDQLPQSMRRMWRRNYEFWTFAVTENGLYTMIQNAKAGDVIASVEGAKVPLILRPQGAYEGKKMYELIGTAYVHGFMDGKAFEMMAELGLVEDQILLQ